ncbi:MAG: PepSY-associated TM helix domain-containing protein, partial [Pseudohongiella sp.]|nr:PepSY-associated TM helix domain-containing protein [Pseudohongiella sp.]
LHFGDYGGLPMQIIWAILNIFTMIVLGSGLYLWWVKYRKVSA